jgi:hypothetical protein
MPFGNSMIDTEYTAKLESIYSKWIKPVVESITIPGTQNEKIACHRADKTFKPGEIITHLIENLISAEIVIADLSQRNPNVFYELGVRHAVGGNCILISDSLDDVPFDLRPLRTIIYQYEPDSMLMLQDCLKQAILEILQDLNTIDNPVRRFIYQRELDKIVREPSSTESDLVKNVLSEMASLRNEFIEQSNETRKIMRLITSTSDDTKTIKPESEIDPKAFEGIWRDSESRSIFYVRVINGELAVPYSYGGFSSLTGHLYNCKLINKTLFGRFEWFESPHSGYMFLRIEGDDQIKGGWWYEEDVPQEIISNLLKVSDSLPKMNKLSLQKITSATEFPGYIEKYFRKKWVR